MHLGAHTYHSQELIRLSVPFPLFKGRAHFYAFLVQITSFYHIFNYRNCPHTDTKIAPMVLAFIITYSLLEHVSNRKVGRPSSSYKASSIVIVTIVTVANVGQYHASEEERGGEQ